MESKPSLQAAKILTPAEEKAIDQTVNDLKDMRDEVEITQGVNFEAKDKVGLTKKIDDLQRIRSTHSIPVLSGAEKERVTRELSVLEADLRKDMPTWTAYERSRPQHGASHAAMVRLIVKWEGDPVRRQKIQRWKTLRRLQDPTDPQASNLMYLFPQ